MRRVYPEAAAQPTGSIPGVHPAGPGPLMAIMALRGRHVTFLCVGMVPGGEAQVGACCVPTAWPLQRGALKHYVRLGLHKDSRPLPAVRSGCLEGVRCALGPSVPSAVRLPLRVS